jgi:hypothetical protein
LVSGFTPTNDCALKPGRSCTNQDNAFYGNLVRGGCPGGSAAFGKGWTTAYNVWTGSGGAGSICGGDTTSLYRKTVKLRAPGPPAYDDHLADCAQPGSALVPPEVNGGRPKVDADGELLPPKWLAGAGADQCDTSVMVLGRSIGAVRLGGKESDLAVRYGRPRSTRSVVLGGHRVRKLTYFAHRSYLWVYVDSEATIVGVGTSSPYYATATGLAVGSSTAEVVARSRLTLLKCKNAYTRRTAGTSVFVVERGGRGRGTVASISLIRGPYAGC